MSRPPVGNDNDPNPANGGEIPSFVGDVIMGVRFFSRLPTGNRLHEAPRMNAMVQTLGMTSVIISIIPALVLAGGILLGLPIFLATCFAIATQIGVTGAMAEDGLADSFDGLWGGHTPNRRLEIMKDSTHGTYGVLALILLLFIRVSALSALMGNGVLAAIILWIGAQVLARQSSVWLMLVLPSARIDGVASSTGVLSKKSFGIGAIFACLIGGSFVAFVVGLFGLIIVAAIMMLIVGVWSRICTVKLEGYSGDVIGALSALVEIGALTTFIIVS